MHYDRMLSELFSEEDRAREMANRLADIARTSREAAAAERDSLLAFLRGPIERHFAFEEEVVFPKLDRHELGPEVQVATKQHAALRQLTDRLGAAQPGDDLRELIFEIARLLLHHTNFEGDYIYPELTHDEWRALMMETVEKGSSVPPPAHDGGAQAAHDTVPAEQSVNS
jgi:hemerythrin superfamily protein